MIVLEVENVKKIYRPRFGGNQVQALSSVSFSVEEGEYVAIMGESGSGKSTLLNLLGGLDSPTEGKIYVSGKDISTLSNDELADYRASTVGFVFQFYNLVQNLTVRENIEMATQICKNPLDIDEVIKAVGLEERKTNFPAQLSGGEQQRVAIARALAKNPKILLCDEPTGALDYNTGKSILKLLYDTCRERNVTVIVITHNLALTAMGDKVIKVKNGLISEIEINENPIPVERIEW